MRKRALCKLRCQSQHTHTMHKSTAELETDADVNVEGALHETEEDVLSTESSDVAFSSGNTSLAHEDFDTENSSVVRYPVKISLSEFTQLARTQQIMWVGLSSFMDVCVRLRADADCQTEDHAFIIPYDEVKQHASAIESGCTSSPRREAVHDPHEVGLIWRHSGSWLGRLRLLSILGINIGGSAKLGVHPSNVSGKNVCVMGYDIETEIPAHGGFPPMSVVVCPYDRREP